MTYTVKLIEHSDVNTKQRYLRLFDLTSLYEEGGFVRKILASELDSMDNFGRFLTPFHIAIAYNDAGAIVGYAFYYPCEKTCEFYVLPHWRQRGVGTVLVGAIRQAWSKTSVIGAFRGFEGWAEFFEAHHILEMDQFLLPTTEAIAKYGDAAKAKAALTKSAKLVLAGKMAKARRATLKDAA